MAENYEASHGPDNQQAPERPGAPENPEASHGPDNQQKIQNPENPGSPENPEQPPKPTDQTDQKAPIKKDHLETVSKATGDSTPK